MTPAGTVLVPVGHDSLVVRIADGKKKRLTAVRHPASGVAFDSAARRAVWLGADEEGFSLSSGVLPPFEDDPRNRVAEKWTTTRVEMGDTWAVAVSPDLTRLAVTGIEPLPRMRDANKVFIPQPVVALFRLDHGESLWVTQLAVVSNDHESPARIAHFSPDGRTLATGSTDSTVKLWDVAKAGKDWKPRATIPTGRFTVVALTFSPDGRTLAAGTTERQGEPNLYLIDVTASKLIASRRMAESVSAVAFSPDGRTLVTGHNLGKIQAWDVAALVKGN